MPQPVHDFRVLVADPSTHMAGLVTLMLHSLKIRAVDEVADVGHATTALTRRPYDLVLIDSELGGENDFAIVRTLRQTKDQPNRLTPIIMMASTPSAAMIAAARDAGVSEFLRKPFSAQHIQMRIDAIRSAPRDFVDTAAYAGPDRRRQSLSAAAGRRASDKKKSA